MSGELREMFSEFNTLSNADGSVMYAQGATIVAAAMLGPIEVKLVNLSIEDSYIECNFRPKYGNTSAKDKMCETIIKDICQLALITDMHPRTKMSVQIQELEDRGGLEATSINAACLALLIGGMPLKFTFAAVHCIVNKTGQLLLDPDIYQMKDCRARVIIVYDSVDGNILSLQSYGSINIAELNKVECVCREASKHIFDYYRQAFTSFHSNELQLPKVENDNEEQSESMEIQQ